MDSGNSGSMQSSSGGEEEYDSRSESISSFLNSSAHFGSISESQQPPAPPSQLLSHAPPTMFNHHSQNLDAFQQSLANPSGNNANQFGTRHQNDQLLWSRGLRSDPTTNFPSFGNISSVSSSTQTVLNVQTGLHQSQSAIGASNAANKASSAGIQADHQQHHHQPNAVKNPKKRTRASRRAPTTVLTTDTTNFRQMVQEFTGIPAAPFSAGSPFTRRLDLFSGAGTGITSNIRSAAGHLDSLGPLYPLRPSAQKAHQQPSLLNSSSMIDSLVSSSTNSGIPPSQSILNMQNQMLSFQGNNSTTSNSNNNNSNNNSSSSAIPSFLQHSSLKQHHPSSMLTGKSQGMSNNNNTSGLPSFDELGLGRHDQNATVNASLDNTTTGLFQNSSGLGNYSSKFNCLASTSEFLHHQHHDKGLENVTSGGGGGGDHHQGTVGSWIVPSD